MINKFVFTLALLLISILSFSQTIKELEERRERTERELNESTQQLIQTEKKREQSLNQLNILKRQLVLRKNLISDIEKQIKLLEKQIQDKSTLISVYENDLNNLKKEYSKLILFAQRNKSDMQILVFIFASSDFNQAYRRLRFYQQFLKFREQQAQQIIQTQQAIEHEVNEISKSRNKLAQSQEDKENEILKLNTQQKRYSQSVSQLQQKESALRKQVEERRQAMEALDKAIEELIAEEARRAKSTVRDARYLRLSKGFSGNKGRLPWPTVTGVIVSDFGEHNHPVLKGVKIRNNGIDISTQLNAKVKSIYEGEVKKIVSIPGQNAAVIIRHGDFLTVYSNLVKVDVSIGEIVKAQQVIGEVYSNVQEGNGLLNLQIWHENKIENPTKWILP